MATNGVSSSVQSRDGGVARETPLNRADEVDDVSNSIFSLISVSRFVVINLDL